MPEQCFLATPLNTGLLFIAGLTAIIETPLFWLCGYRRARQYMWFAAVNVISNILLNEYLSTLQDIETYNAVILPAELLVVLLEFFLCLYTVDGKYGRLLLTVLFTNAFSYLLGVLLADVLYF